MFLRFFFVFVYIVFFFSSIARAQNNEKNFIPPKTDWTITVGLAPVYSPVFQGAKDYGFSIFPDLRFNYKDDFFASVPDGIGYNVINNNNWKIGPLAKVRFGRRENTGGSPFLISGKSDALRGLGDIDTAGEFGGFSQYNYQKTRTRLEIRKGFGGHNGLVGDFSFSYFDRIGPLTYSFGPKITFGTSDFMNTYYGISDSQSLRSGLSHYKAKGGINTYGIRALVNMPINSKVAITIFSGYEKLASQASNSPLVRERGSQNQFSIGLGFGYRFGWS